jgi:hypothetical protein
MLPSTLRLALRKWHSWKYSSLSRSDQATVALYQRPSEHLLMRHSLLASGAMYLCAENVVSRLAGNTDVYLRYKF